MKFGVCDFPRFAVTDWRLRRWRLWCLALKQAKRSEAKATQPDLGQPNLTVTKSDAALRSSPRQYTKRCGKAFEDVKRNLGLFAIVDSHEVIKD